MTFAEVLMKAMVRKGVTPQKVQEDTKIPWTTLSTWLGKANTKPTVSKSFKKVVIYLGLTLEEILEIA